jgi:uncharacterized protein YjhX (UPF0386 family)
MAQASAVDQIPLLVRVLGRVEGVREVESESGKKSYRIRLKTPAPDRFASAGTVEVRSGSRLGQKGEEIEVFCSLKGYRNSGISQSTGKPYDLVQHVLDAVAA